MFEMRWQRRKGFTCRGWGAGSPGLNDTMVKVHRAWGKEQSRNGHTARRDLQLPDICMLNANILSSATRLLQFLGKVAAAIPSKTHLDPLGTGADSPERGSHCSFGARLYLSLRSDRAEPSLTADRKRIIVPSSGSSSEPVSAAGPAPLARCSSGSHWLPLTCLSGKGDPLLSAAVISPPQEPSPALRGRGRCFAPPLSPCNTTGGKVCPLGLTFSPPWCN